MTVETKYSVPFDTTKHPVLISQGYNGLLSHFLSQRKIEEIILERDLTYAVDFALPLGTEVKAARAGRVYNLWLGSYRYYAGLDPIIGNNLPANSTNFVVIMHEDGTKAWYAHLSTEKRVQIGQIVNLGAVIGSTGQSGWIGEIPHLHFMVYERTQPGVLSRTLPISFHNLSYFRNP